MKIKIILFLLVIATYAFGQNGVEIVMENKGYDSKGVVVKEQQSNTIWMTENKIKISSESNSEPLMIFNAEKQEMIMMYRDQKKYVVIDKKTMQEIKTKMDESKAMMEAQLASMPEAQREIMEKQMGTFFGNDVKVIPTEYTVKDQGVRVGPYTTDLFIGTKNQEKVEEIFMASNSQFDINIDYFEPFRQMMKFMRENMSELFKSMPGESSSIIRDESHPAFSKGVPVKTVNYKDGVKQSEETLLSIKSLNLPSEAFDVIPGYKKMDLMKEMNNGN